MMNEGSIKRQQEEINQKCAAAASASLQDRTGTPTPYGLANDYGIVGCLANPTLRDRLKTRIERASQEQRKIRKADELMDLLCKNPDVARILELVEELNGGSW